MQSWSVGDVTITRVPDDEFELIVPQDETTTAVLRSQASWLAPHFVTPEGALRLGSSAVVLHTSDTVIVVDPWLAFDDPDRSSAAAAARIHRLLALLDAARFAPAEVDIVVNTHVDGVGANTRPDHDDEVAAFPNARYLLAPEEIAALRSGRHPKERPLRDLVAAGVVEPITPGELTPGVMLEPGPGHATGHHVVRVGDSGDGAVIVGHLFLHPAQVYSPDPRAGLDENPKLAAETRRGLIERAAGANSLVIGPLWASPGAGRVVPSDEPGRWQLEVAG